MSSPTSTSRSLGRLYLSAVFFSAWMVLLLTGFVFGGAAHLLLMATLAFFPWRASGAVDDSEVDDSEAEDSR